MSHPWSSLSRKLASSLHRKSKFKLTKPETRGSDAEILSIDEHTKEPGLTYAPQQLQGPKKLHTPMSVSDAPDGFGRPATVERATSTSAPGAQIDLGTPLISLEEAQQRQWEGRFHIMRPLHPRRNLVGTESPYTLPPIPKAGTSVPQQYSDIPAMNAADVSSPKALSRVNWGACSWSGEPQTVAHPDHTIEQTRLQSSESKMRASISSESSSYRISHGTYPPIHLEHAMQGVVIRTVAEHYKLSNSAYKTSEDLISCRGDIDLHVTLDTDQSFEHPYMHANGMSDQKRAAYLQMRAGEITVNDIIPRPLHFQRSSSTSEGTANCTDEETLSITWSPPTPTVVSNSVNEPYVVADHAQDLEETIAALKAKQMESRTGLKTLW